MPKAKRKVILIHPISLNIIKIFNSVPDAANYLEVFSANIYEFLNDKLRHCAGYFLRYLDEYMTDEYIWCDSNLECDLMNFTHIGGNLNNYYNIYSCIINNLDGEEWKDVNGYEGLYKISNYGRLISLHYYPYISLHHPIISTSGYYRVTMSRNCIHRYMTIHKLVADAFIPNNLNLSCVNHKDENKLNNNVNNLEWCNHYYNNHYGTRSERHAKSISKKIYKIDIKSNKVISVYDSVKEAGNKNNINASNLSFAAVNNVIRGGFIWKYNL